jgi:starch phosphorylase
VAENKLDFYSALQVVAAGNIFTTHTPVPAGNDAFGLDLMRKYFSAYPAKVGIDFDTFVSFGQTRNDPTEPFSMTILALRTSRHANGVSALHGRVSQGLWKDVWAGVPQEEVPITSITNGIHTKTWMAPEIGALFDKYLPNWEENLTDSDFWRGVNRHSGQRTLDDAPKAEEPLVEFARERIRVQRTRLGEPPEKIALQSPAQSRGADDRLCPAIRDLQAGDVALLGSGPAAQAAREYRAAGAVHLRGQGAPER